MFGRAGTPQPILDRMHAAITQAVSESDVKGRIEEQGCDVIASSPEECRRFVAAEIERWGQVIRQNDIRADS
jgi:tripartite-type tricarboxylate transporter receptor subunit TctC